MFPDTSFRSFFFVIDTTEEPHRIYGHAIYLLRW